MNDLAKKVLELASEDKGFHESFTKAPDLETIVALLKEKGVEATAEELEAALKPEGGVSELSEDELEAVAGGSACACVSGGGGASGGNDNVCGCIVGGIGMDRDPQFPATRCACPLVGGGTSHN